MTNRGTDKRPRRRIHHALGFAALCAGVVAIGVSASTAGAGNHPTKTLGKTKHTPDPRCPKNCQVIGSVTGFQIKADGQRHVFRANESGRIVAWAVSVANTNRYEDRIFGNTDFFGTKNLGGHPTARLAVLKKKSGPHYKLLRQSDVVDLKSDQGHKAYITLNKPLKIKKGLIVALTTQTWAPVLGVNRGVVKDSSWRASRHSGKCNGSTDAQRRALAIAARPQTKIDSTRQYGCIYQGRLIYWAYYTPGLH